MRYSRYTFYLPLCALHGAIWILAELNGPDGKCLGRLMVCRSICLSIFRVVNKAFTLSGPFDIYDLFFCFPLHCIPYLASLPLVISLVLTLGFRLPPLGNSIFIWLFISACAWGVWIRISQSFFAYISLRDAVMALRGSEPGLYSSQSRLFALIGFFSFAYGDLFMGSYMVVCVGFSQSCTDLQSNCFAL